MKYSALATFSVIAALAVAAASLFGAGAAGTPGYGLARAAGRGYWSAMLVGVICFIIFFMPLRSWQKGIKTQDPKSRKMAQGKMMTMILMGKTAKGKKTAQKATLHFFNSSRLLLASDLFLLLTFLRRTFESLLTCVEIRFFFVRLRVL